MPGEGTKEITVSETHKLQSTAQLVFSEQKKTETSVVMAALCPRPVLQLWRGVCRAGEAQQGRSLSKQSLPSLSF